MPSTSRLPRASNGTPSASNSSRSHPAPTPRDNRPPLSASSDAACFARTTGFRSGRTSTAVPIVARSVALAISVIATTASKYGIVVDHVARPSAAKG